MLLKIILSNKNTEDFRTLIDSTQTSESEVLEAALSIYAVTVNAEAKNVVGFYNSLEATVTPLDWQALQKKVCAAQKELDLKEESPTQITMIISNSTLPALDRLIKKTGASSYAECVGTALAVYGKVVENIQSGKRFGILNKEKAQFSALDISPFGIDHLQNDSSSVLKRVQIGQQTAALLERIRQVGPTGGRH